MLDSHQVLLESFLVSGLYNRRTIPCLSNTESSLYPLSTIIELLLLKRRQKDLIALCLSQRELHSLSLFPAVSAWQQRELSPSLSTFNAFNAAKP